MTDRLVIDTSVALKWFLEEPDSGAADALLTGELELLAPDFLLLEVANGLRRQQRGGAISQADVAHAIADLPRAFADLLPARSLVEPALKLSQQFDHSVYDCLFLAMAQMRGAPLITADAAFVAKVAGTAYAQNVVLLADWKP
jgi:predicted nucleic acid-binding protein